MSLNSRKCFENCSCGRHIVSMERRLKHREVMLNPERRKLSSETIKRTLLLETEEQKKLRGRAISKAKKGIPNLKLRGKGHGNWQGGIASLTKTERNLFMHTLEYKDWRTKIFERDNYTCQICQIRSKKGVKVYLHVDHIKPYKDFPELRLDLNNGRTLCETCHRKTPTWGNRR